MPRPHRLTAYAALAALTIPCGIAVHLFAETAGLGYRRDAELLFSSLHLYLAALAVLSPLVLFAALRRARGSNTRKMIARIAASLPFQGSGPRFFALSFALQLGFFIITQFGEGCPLRAGNLGVGLLAAVVASAIAAAATALCKTDLLLVAAELFCLLDAATKTANAPPLRYHADARTNPQRFRALLRAAANLPPPRPPTAYPFHTLSRFVGDACLFSLPPLKRGMGGFLPPASSALR